MLRRAGHRVRRAGWSNTHLIEADIHDLTPSLCNAYTLGEPFDAVVCALGFTGLIDWERAFDRCFELLRAGGRFAIFDAYAEKRTIQTWNTELVSRGDLSRRVWQPLEKATADFEMKYLPGSPWVFGGRLFVATGTK